MNNIYSQEENINESDKTDFELEKIVGSRLANQYKDLTNRIVKEIPFIYQEAMRIQKEHRKVMKELYPDEDIREFDFDIKVLKTKKNNK